jgi:hypothetical protein
MPKQSDPTGWRGNRERSRTIRFREDDLLKADRLACRYDLPFSIIVRKCLSLLLADQSLQCKLLGYVVTRRVS